MKTNPYALPEDTTDINSWKIQQQPTPDVERLNKTIGVCEEPTRPLFDDLVTDRLTKAVDVCKKRGDQYGDTLRNGQWLVLKAVAKKCGIELTLDQARKLAIAALCDVKYQRFEGGYKEDHCDDGINYLACLAELMSRINDK